MFRGSLPAALQAVIREHATTWDADAVHVGCSGNFTIERVLAPLDRFALHGNDVQIYSCAIGATLAGNRFPILVRPEHHDEWGWLEEWQATPTDALATVLLASRALVGVGKENDYYRRVHEEYRHQWAGLHRKTVAKIETADLSLASFYAGDVQHLVDTAPADDAFVCFPPFFEGDYEQQFRHLEQVLAWEQPTYDVLDQDGITSMFVRAQRFKHWLIGTHVRRPDLEPHLRAHVQTTNRGVGVWVYSSDGHPRVVVPRQDVDPPAIPHLGHDELGDRAALHVLTGPQFQALRSLYMNPNIKPGQPSLSLALTVDGRLVGCVAYSLAPTLAQWHSKIPEPVAYLLSDFPVDGTRYRRLAKLLVCASISREALALCERYANHRFRSIVTTAYTPKPVSMKYRGVLDLLNRKKLDPSDEGGPEGYTRQGYELNYGSPAPRWGLQEAFDYWRARWGEEDHGT